GLHGGFAVAGVEIREAQIVVRQIRLVPHAVDQDSLPFGRLLGDGRAESLDRSAPILVVDPFDAFLIARAVVGGGGGDPHEKNRRAGEGNTAGNLAATLRHGIRPWVSRYAFGSIGSNRPTHIAVFPGRTSSDWDSRFPGKRALVRTIEYFPGGTAMANGV